MLCAIQDAFPALDVEAIPRKYFNEARGARSHFPFPAFFVEKG
jgi:hypothetical protein